MNKKKILIIGIIILIFITLFIATGLKKTEVYLTDYEVSADGKTMTIKVDTAGSSNYIRKIKKTSGSTNGYYSFYKTFGINSNLGTKNTFEIELDDDMDEIYFNTDNKGYKLILTKDKINKEWIKINYANKENMKLDLPNIDKINKFGINTGSQDNNYFEYTDKDTINKVYDILKNLETDIPSTTYNPETDLEVEMYDISFDTDEYKNKLEYNISVYKKSEKYYVEQRYNGIYEITIDDFNIIKSYVTK